MDEETRRRARLRAATIGLAALLAALGAGSAHAERGAALWGEFLVGFKAGVPASEQREVLARAGASERRHFGRIRAAVVSANERVLERLRRDPRVRYAEPNFALHADVVPNDPLFDRLWGLVNTGQSLNGFSLGVPDADIDADEAWNVTTGRPGVVVAVIDTGVDLGHPDLAANLWTNSGEDCAGCRSDGVDNDGNGYVDDWRGWDWANRDADPSDDHGHGTHVAGTIAAVADNGTGVVGVAPNVRVMPLKFLRADGNGTTDDAIAAIFYAVDKGAVVLNNSWSGDEFSQALRDAIEVADAKRALFVAAAGNDGLDNDARPAYPSSYDAPNLISVAASDNSDEPAFFSNFGKRSVDLAAPGLDIWSTWPGGYQAASGTSMAAPHVSGAAALAFSAFPSATPVGVKALLLGTVDAKASLAGLVATGGRLNVGRAVACSNQPQVALDAPADGFDVDVGTTVSVRAVAAACADPLAVTVSATLNGAPLSLTARGDGLYTGTFTPTAAGAYTLRVSAGAGGSSATASASGAASTVYPISPGGSPVTITTAVPGQAMRLSFPGTAGQRVSLRLSDATLGRTSVTFVDPNGAAIALPVAVGSTGGFVDTKTLSADGTYGIRVEPASASASGSITLTLYDVPADAAQEIVPGGQPATLATTVPGQNGRFTFTGAAGRRVSMKVASGIGSGTITLRRPDGLAVGSPAAMNGAGGFVDTKTLPLDGAYSIVVDPSGANTGSVTVTLYDVPDDAGGTLAFGAAAGVTTTVPGQNARLSFDGAAGGRISVALTNVTFARATVSILRPDGKALGPNVLVGTNGGFVDVQTLPVAGRYTVVVDPYSDATGSARLTLYDVPPDADDTLTFASPATTSVSVPGQNARLRFAGRAGGRVSVSLSGVTISSSRVSIVGPDGDPIGTSTLVGTNGAFVDVRTLPADGTYAVFVDPQAASTGSMTVTAYDVPPDATGALTLDGPAQIVTLATPGQNARLTFDGVIGAKVTLKFASVTIPSFFASVVRPGGASLLPATLVGPSGKIATLTLPDAGTYAVVVDPRLAGTGSVSVSLATAP